MFTTRSACSGYCEISSAVRCLARSSSSCLLEAIQVELGAKDNSSPLIGFYLRYWNSDDCPPISKIRTSATSFAYLVAPGSGPSADPQPLISATVGRKGSARVGSLPMHGHSNQLPQQHSFRPSRDASRRTGQGACEASGVSTLCIHLAHIDVFHLSCLVLPVRGSYASERTR